MQQVTGSDEYRKTWEKKKGSDSFSNLIPVELCCEIIAGTLRDCFCTLPELFNLLLLQMDMPSLLLKQSSQWTELHWLTCVYSDAKGCGQQVVEPSAAINLVILSQAAILMNGNLNCSISSAIAV